MSNLIPADRIADIRYPLPAEPQKPGDIVTLIGDFGVSRGVLQEDGSVWLIDDE